MKACLSMLLMANAISEIGAWFCIYWLVFKFFYYHYLPATMGKNINSSMYERKHYTNMKNKRYTIKVTHGSVPFFFLREHGSVPKSVVIYVAVVL